VSCVLNVQHTTGHPIESMCRNDAKIRTQKRRPRARPLPKMILSGVGLANSAPGDLAFCLALRPARNAGSCLGALSLRKGLQLRRRTVPHRILDHINAGERASSLGNPSRVIVRISSIPSTATSNSQACRNTRRTKMDLTALDRRSVDKGSALSVNRRARFSLPGSQAPCCGRPPSRVGYR
jgi:hypothetical protein